MENKDRLAPQPLPVPAQDAGQSQQDGGVGVAAAGVHDAGVPGGEGQALRLLDGERVEVGAKGDDGPLPIPLEARDDPVLAAPRKGDALLLELPAEIGGGFLLVKGGAGVLVDIPAVFHSAGIFRRGRAFDFVPHSVSFIPSAGQASACPADGLCYQRVRFFISLKRI